MCSRDYPPPPPHPRQTAATFHCVPSDKTSTVGNHALCNAPRHLCLAFFLRCAISRPQITAEYIFASLATLSEFVVFLYMGMGVFTGRFREWDWRFIGLAIVFCLAARLFNTFPFSALANLW